MSMENYIFGGVCFVSGIAIGALAGKLLKNLDHKKFSFTYESEDEVINNDTLNPIMDMKKKDVNIKINEDPLKVKILKNVFSYLMNLIDNKCDELGISNEPLRDEDFKSKLGEVLKRLLLSYHFDKLDLLEMKEVEKEMIKDVESDIDEFMNTSYTRYMNNHNYAF